MPNKVKKDCPYNEGVGCYNTKQCATCGWNPQVAQERLEKVQNSK